jgi:hypothetical protein
MFSKSWTRSKRGRDTSRKMKVEGGKENEGETESMNGERATKACLFVGRPCEFGRIKKKPGSRVESEETGSCGGWR